MSMDVWANVAILLMYGSHDMRHKYSAGLRVVNGPPGFGASHHKALDSDSNISIFCYGFRYVISAQKVLF